MIIRIVSFLMITFSLFSCSSSIEETREKDIGKENETYVFDDIPENEIEDENESLNKAESYFLIQIGAFTTKHRAEDFVQEIKNKLGSKVNVSYSSDVNLFVVQLDKKFITKKEAETVKNQIKEKEEFKDAWIVSVPK